MTSLIAELEQHRMDRMEDDNGPTEEELEFYVDRPGGYAAVMLVPHEENYQEVLSYLSPDDVVCDMGAGDLRFALMASKVVKKVYAVELSPITVSDALGVIGYRIPPNVVVICADWRLFPVPSDVTAITCMVNGCSPDPIWNEVPKVIFGFTNGNGGDVRCYVDEVIE